MRIAALLLMAALCLLLPSSARTKVRLRVQRCAKRAARIAGSGLNPDSVKDARFGELTVGHAIEADAARNAQIALARHTLGGLGKP